MTVPYSLQFPFGLGGPPSRGVLRARPEDFRVSERLAFEPAGAGEHWYLHVRKTGANTEWAARQIARVAHVRAVDVGYAGRKDRNAVTEQWFSLWLPGRLPPGFSTLACEGIEVLRMVRHGRKLRPGMHMSNRFDICVRDLAEGNGAIEARIEALAERGFPNYFGEQRFGLGGANLHYADEVMKGRDVPFRHRGMYISAARSYLYNRQLARHVTAGDWDAPGAFGWLPGVSRTGDDIPRDESLVEWHEGLVRLGVKAMRRPLRVIPRNLLCKREGETLRLSFELPVGSFATSLLRELIDHHDDEEVDCIEEGERVGQVA